MPTATKAASVPVRSKITEMMLTADFISWRDKPITDCTREELLEALVGAFRRINQLRDERDQLEQAGWSEAMK